MDEYRFDPLSVHHRAGIPSPWLGLVHQGSRAERRFDLWRFGDCAGQIDSV